MDRFAQSSFIKNIGVRKPNVNKVCRCCGLNAEDTYSILEQISYDGIEFKEKLEKLTDIKVEATDKMPQKLCIVCMDKINDFFEFRLMAQNTEKQIREALGIPTPKPQGVKRASVSLIDLKYAAKDKLLLEQALARLKEEQPATSKKRCEKIAVVPQPPTKKSKKEIRCNICTHKDTHFAYSDDLNDHLMATHRPSVAKYACGSCKETFQQLSDFKTHQAYHQKEKIPYTCFICDSLYARHNDFVRHMSSNNCLLREKMEVTVEDIKCFQCKKKFLTQNLFEWHGCFLKTKGNCSKCGKFYAKKQSLFKHYVLCPDKFKPPVDKVKTEAGASKVTASKTKPTSSRRSSTLPAIVKSELNIGPGPPPDDAGDNYDITFDTFPNDSDSDEEPPSNALEPEVNLQETTPAVAVKQEKTTSPAVQQQKPPPISPSHNQIIRNIKKERASSDAIINPSAILNVKIKKEPEAKSVLKQYLNPMALKLVKPGPKRFKIPQILAMKIKQERKDVGYGDTDKEERDEADPEEGDFFHDKYNDNVSAVKIKQEKQDLPICENVTKGQLINPMALAGLRKKAVSNGDTENPFLVISAVTSINSDALVVAENGEALETAKAPLKEVVSSAMVQIPSANLEVISNNEPSDALVQSDEPPLAEGMDPVSENVTSLPNVSDELDDLLKSYENCAPPDVDLLKELKLD